MSFLEALNGGLEKANETERKCEEVTSVFKTMNTELESFSKAKIRVRRARSALSGLRAWTEKKADDKSAGAYFVEDVLNLYVGVKADSNAVIRVAGWRQSINGWPCTVSFEGQDVVCFSAGELENTLQELLNSSSFGRALSERLKKPS